MTSTRDLTTIAGVEDYVRDTPFASSTVMSLSGGTGNYTYRLYLETPHEGKSTAILKHSTSYVKSLPTIPFAIERQVSQVCPHLMQLLMEAMVAV